MASFILTGTVVEPKRSPIGVLQTDRDFTVLGSVVLMDATLSTDPDGGDITYQFSFLAVPISSKVVLEGFRVVSEGGASVSFSPDVTGRYVIGLVVSNGVFESQAVSKTIDVQPVLVPHAKGIVPDGKFIWSYLRDVWTQVENKEFFETLWSALIQIAGADLLKLYQIDFNKSIADIQDLYQRRWLSYEPKLDLVTEDLTFFIGNQASGAAAATGATGTTGLAIIVGANELIAVQGAIRPDLAGRTFRVQYSRNPENVGDYAIHGVSSRPGGFFVGSTFPKSPANTLPPTMSDLIAQNVGFGFAFQSKNWSIGGNKVYDFIMSDILGIPTYKTVVPPGLEDVRTGDVILITAGANAGAYTVVTKDGPNVVVNKAPPSSSELGSDQSRGTVYRPVGFSIPPVEEALTDTLTIPVSESGALPDLVPGRVIVFNGQARTVTRVSVDNTQRVPVAVLVIESNSVSPGMKGLSWFIPHTLVSASQDFGALGVSPGDTLVVSIEDNQGLAVEVALQVIGVDGHRLGFVMTDEPVVPGVMPVVSPATIVSVVDRFDIQRVKQLSDGSLKYEEEAAALLTTIRSIFFRNTYWNKELTSATQFRVGARSFTASPKRIIRNSRVPVDPSVRSIPALQEYIQQPAVEEANGQKYLAYPNHQIPIGRDPVVLTERYHYLVDAGVALKGTLTFRTDTDVVDADGGDFVDLGLSSGDSFVIEAPITLAGSYEIVQVLSRNRLKLFRKIPKYPLSEYVTAQVRLARSHSGQYLRFVPGLFSAKNPAPSLLWGEVTFFDNDPNIERNFGILVGLTKADIEAVSGNATYRQAVAGLMYAYVSGAAIDKVRLGASLLLGLPFTERRGIIRSVEENYRLDPAGAPTMGRILVEDVDATGAPSGVLRIYTFPIDAISSLAGVSTNPTTGKAYAVGDIVEAYASLAKGVEIQDFVSMTSGLSSLQLLQRYHSVRVRINDNIFNQEEILLVSDFLRRITPSYIALVITNSSEYLDELSVRDLVRLRMTPGAYGAPPFLDHVGNLFPVALAYDFKLFSGVRPMRWDSVPSEVRYSGGDIVIDDVDPTALSVPSGGLVSQAGLKTFESPLCRVGDRLVLVEGSDAGIYLISEVADATLKVSDGPSSWSFSGPVHFAIFRPASHLIRTGTISAYSDSTFTDSDNSRVYLYSLMTVETGLRRDGVAPGDWVLVTDGVVSSRHVVLGIAGPSATFPATPDVLPVAPFTQLAVSPPVSSGNTSYRVYRPAAFVSSVADFELVSDGTNTVEVNDPYIMSLADIGDEIQLLAEGLPRLLILDPLNLWVTPAPVAGTYQAKLLKPVSGGTSLTSLGIATRLISDQAAVSVQNAATVARVDAGTATPGPDCDISGSTITWGAYGSLSPAGMGLRPGDFFRPLSSVGTNLTRDLGYGPGLYPIVEVSDTTVKLSVALSNGRSQWAVMRRW